MDQWWEWTHYMILREVGVTLIVSQVPTWEITMCLVSSISRWVAYHGNCENMHAYVGTVLKYA